MKNPIRRAFLTGAASFVAMRPGLAQSVNALSAADVAIKLLDSVPALGERSLGDPAAKVTMIEYASVTCTYSAAFNETVWPGLKRDFVDTGKLRLIFREFPMDRLALDAFMLARCIPEKDYFATIDLMFKQQTVWRGKDAGRQLFRIMQLSGMTEAEFKSCVEDENIGKPIVEAARLARETFGVKATPTFFVNGRMIDGRKDQMAVRAAVENALA
ncbi:MAG: DsbA family protein [Hyphomicrobiales bacterium]|nr:DsbA family protein [Hyphomicrobiales bacterium]